MATEPIITPPISGGFIENLNIVAAHLRKTDDSIIGDLHGYIDIARAWAENPHGVEPEPIDYPGMFSALSNAIDSLTYAQASEASAVRSEAQVALAAEQVGLAEDQVALAAEQVALAKDEVALAEAQVALAALEVQKAIDQVVLATTQATNSATSATESETSATASETSNTNSELRMWESEAEQMTSAQYATELNDFVSKFTSDGDGTFTPALTSDYSSAYWAREAKLAATGLVFKGMWDIVDCSEPPVPTPETGKSADGWMWIVGSVSGDSSLCPNATVGDWLIWAGDDAATTPVEGGWEIMNWTFDWTAITNIPENVSNALSRSGGVMTGDIVVNGTGTDDLFVKVAGSISSASLLADGIHVLNSFHKFTMRVDETDGGVDFKIDDVTIMTLRSGTPPMSPHAPTDTNHLVRKDYVDTRLIDGGTW